MSVSKAKNIQLTIVATIIPLGVWGGIEIKKRYEQTLGKKLTTEEVHQMYHKMSDAKIRREIEKLEKEKATLESESVTLIGKREKAVSINVFAGNKSQK
ncbi:hypothetical protein AYI70_g1425 [Smittium culicis]|uniref:Uncharacterized protein n=1 Tax=Smittium culicis TaxID=133412 RepID=A0A1R1YCZ1_9FUNG|nr:hypothetical protein AYI70_g1425 [Smittium culicis]